MRRVKCPKCRQVMELASLTAGQRMQCENCKGGFRIPGDTDRAAATATERPTWIAWFNRFGVGVLCLSASAAMVVLAISFATAPSAEPAATAEPPGAAASVSQDVRITEGGGRVRRDSAANAVDLTDVGTRAEVVDDSDEAGTEVAPEALDEESAPGNMSGDELYELLSPAVVRIDVYDGDDIGDRTRRRHGSGFFVSDDGLLVTNYHVIADASFALVHDVSDNDPVGSQSRRVAPVRGVWAKNREVDLAIVKVDGNDWPHLTLGGVITESCG